MNKEMVDMTNREMLVELMRSMNGVQDRLDGLSARMDGVEKGLGELSARIDRVEKGLGELNARVDGVEKGLGELSARVDGVEEEQRSLHDRINMLEDNINMEIQAVRTEMEVVNKFLKRDIGFLNEKIDRILILKDVDGIEKMKIRLDVLEQGYQTLRVKIG